MTRAAVVIVTALLAAVGCSDAIEPNLTGPRPFAVFAVLNTATDSQIVRLTATSEPTDAHPTIKPIDGASVTLWGPEGTFFGQPVVRSGEPGTPDSVLTEFVIAPFRPQRGATYSLYVGAPSGVAAATVVVPSGGPSAIWVRDFFVLQSPNQWSLTTPITPFASLAPETMGLMIRFLIEYEELHEGVWRVGRIEVPLAYPANATVIEPVYPTLIRRQSVVTTDGRSPAPEAVIFTTLVYEQTLAILHARFGQENVRMRKAVFYLTQAERHFFTYYSFANGFEDPLSIRVDQPDYSNVSGGVGVFGAVALDSVEYAIPTNVGPR